MKKFKSPLEAFEYWEKNTPDQEFLRQNHSGKLDVLTYREAGIQARKVANFLKKNNYKGLLAARMTCVIGNSIKKDLKHLIKLNLFDLIHWQLYPIQYMHQVSTLLN